MANITSLRNEVLQHHFERSENIISACADADMVDINIKQFAAFADSSSALL